MNFKQTAFPILVILGLPALALAEAGYTSANFLQIGSGARAAAMADSFTALSDDATAVFWNPAGIAQAQGTQLSLTHSQWLQGVNLETVALSQNLGEGGGIGLGFSSLGLQSFLSTVEDSSGNFAGTGPSVNAGDWNFIAGYSNYLSRFIPGPAFNHTLLGAEVNLVGQNEAGPTGTALSFNAGVLQLFPTEHFTLGLDVVNLGANLQNRSLPLDLKSGVSWYSSRLFNPGDRLTLAVDADLYSDTGFQPRFGSEYRLPMGRSDVGFLRAGLRTTDNQYGFSFLALGAGLEHTFSEFAAELDYAYVPYGTIGPTQRLTLNLRLVESGKDINAALTGPARFNLDSPGVPLNLQSHASQPVASWTLVLSDEKGREVNEIKGKGDPPTSYTWNGRDSSGTLVVPGSYRAALQLKDEQGQTASSNPVSFQAIGPLSLNNVQWTLSSDAAFGVAEADLSIVGKQKLTVVGKGLKKYFGDIEVEIQGHTDSRPCRPGPHCKFKNNQELSEARAKTVKSLFVGLGLKPENIKVVGLADRVPVAGNETAEGRGKNRRIEIKIKSSRVETAESISNAGQFLETIGQWDQALQLFRMLVDHNPEKPEAYRQMAVCYAKLGRADEAQKAEELAHKLGGATK
jgi:outer membrane protein OmpA-like peptidoglycan-associated protein